MNSTGQASTYDGPQKVGPPAENRVGAVQMQSASLKSSLDQLSAAIEALEHRLVPALCDRGARTQAVGGDPREPQRVICEVADELRKQVERVQFLQTAIESLTDRIDV